MWIRFVQQFCWTATPSVSVVFKPDGGPHGDGRYPVTRACADLAIASGAADKIKTGRGQHARKAD